MVENRDFFIHYAFGAPLGDPRRNIAITFSTEKLEWCEKSFMICLAISTQYRCVTDRRIDGQTFATAQSALCISIAR